jgi:hypothetical protein
LRRTNIQAENCSKPLRNNSEGGYKVGFEEDTVAEGEMLCTSIAQRGGCNYFLKQRDSPPSISMLIKS